MGDIPMVPWKLWIAALSFVAANTLSILAFDTYMQSVEPAVSGPRDAPAPSGPAAGAHPSHSPRPDVRGAVRVARYSGSPGGFASNPTPAFVIAGPQATSPARFLFSAGDGLIAAWSGEVDFSHAFVAIDASSRGAVYKGIAIASAGASSVLYAADFRNNRIDVFDARFERIPTPGNFADPALPSGFAPFGIEVIDGRVFVAYALQDASRRDDVRGRGHGVINVFDPSGRLVRRLVSGGRLNSPWRMAVARPGSGPLAGTLWVGNHGDGRVHAFDLETGALVAEVSAGSPDPSVDGAYPGPARPGAPDGRRGAPERVPDADVPRPMPPRRARFASRFDHAAAREAA